MPVVEAVAVVVILLVAAALITPRLLEDREDAVIGAVLKLGGNEVRCVTHGRLAALLALVLLGVFAVLLLTR